MALQGDNHAANDDLPSDRGEDNNDNDETTPLILTRTDPGYPHHHHHSSPVTETKDEDDESLTKLLWLHRNPDEQATKPDGVVVIPYDLGVRGETQPVCWFVAMDASGSMRTVSPGQRLTRWQIACQLLEKVVTDLLASGRHSDTITLVTFHSRTDVLCENQPLTELRDGTFLQHLTELVPNFNTNIQAANSALHSLMLTNPCLKAGTHRAAEIFFTDGEATEGLDDPKQLQQQKTQLYTDLVTRLNLTLPPFLWCGAISTTAQWRVVRSLSQASPLSLWAYIRDQEMQNFAGEVGGMVTTVVNLRTYTLPPLGSRAGERTVMLLPDTDNAYYCTAPPVQSPMDHAEATALITLYKVRSLLEDHLSGRSILTLKVVQECQERVRARHKTAEPFISTSVKWSQKFDQMQTELLDDLDLMIRNFHSTGLLDLSRQVSAGRDLYSSCAQVQTSVTHYATAFQTVNP